MGRPRIYYDYELPHGVVETVRGVVMDYDRREQAIKRSTITGSVLERYIELNDAVDAALGEVDVGIRGDMMLDVALNTGYAFSQCARCIGRKAYYQKKKKFIYDIAVRIFLVPK